jgi:hypothetical protein
LLDRLDEFVSVAKACHLKPPGPKNPKSTGQSKKVKNAQGGENARGHKLLGGGCCESQNVCIFDISFLQRYQTLFFPEPNIVASVTKATTVHSQQLSQCPL